MRHAAGLWCLLAAIAELEAQIAGLEDEREAALAELLRQEAPVLLELEGACR